MRLLFSPSNPSLPPLLRWKFIYFRVVKLHTNVSQAKRPHGLCSGGRMRTGRGALQGEPGVCLPVHGHGTAQRVHHTLGKPTENTLLLLWGEELKWLN